MRRGLLVAFVAIAASCGFVEPTVDCDDSTWEPGQTCEEVLEAAQPELPPAWEIERLSAVQGIHCPPAAAGCPFTPFVVTVYADLLDGRQLAVMVDLHDDGSLHPRRAEAVETIP